MHELHSRTGSSLSRISALGVDGEVGSLFPECPRKMSFHLRFTRPL